MQNKVALFAFNGDPMCFVHVLLNAMEMAKNDVETLIVIEGEATKLLPGLAQKGAPLHSKWEQIKKEGIIAGVCLACANKMGTRDSAVEQGLELIDDMSGHVSMYNFIKQGYEILIF